MFSSPAPVRVFVCREATDMRKSFDGLSILCRQALSRDPLSGHLFVFFNRRRDQVKILSWDRSGFAIWAKRLERGRFEIPPLEEVQPRDLLLVLEGVDLSRAVYRTRFTLSREARGNGLESASAGGSFSP